MYKLKYHKKQKKLFQNFKANFEKAILEFKAEKRKAFEEKAGKSITEVMSKHIFRNKL